MTGNYFFMLELKLTGKDIIFNIAVQELYFITKMRSLC